MKSTKTLTKKLVEAAVASHIRYWVDLLRLQGWDIEYKVVPYKEEDDFVARIFTQPYFQTAQMEVVNPFDNPSQCDSDVKVQLEATVVHELLHLRYQYQALGIDRNRQSEWDTYEAATDITAYALVAARHGMKRIVS